MAPPPLPPVPHRDGIPYLQTFLFQHVAEELARNDDVLAVSRLARRWEDRFADPQAKARLAAVLNLHDFFYRSHIDDHGRRVPMLDPGTRLYFPLAVRPVGQASRQDADLTALLRRLNGSDPCGVVLTTGSGAGKTTAARKAFLDCFFAPPHPPDLVGPSAPPSLAGFLPCWLRLHADTPTLKPWREKYGGLTEKDDADDYKQKSRQQARAPIVEELLLATAGLPFTAPIRSWLDAGPPLLLFVDLNAADAFTRAVVGMALADFQRTYAGRHRCVVAYRSTQPDDETVRSDQFAAYDLDPIDKTQAVAYLGNVRDYEADMAGRLDLEAPRRDVAAERAKLEELIDVHADPRGRSLICTPLLMHLMSELEPGQVGAIHSLADLYDQVVKAQFGSDREKYNEAKVRKLPDHVGWAPRGQRFAPLGAEEGLRTAQARLALVMKAQGGNSLSLEETRNVLTQPSLGRRSARPWTPADPDFAWEEAPYYTAEFSTDTDVLVILEFGLLRRHGDEVRFLHDSLIDYFAGAVAVGQAEGPMLRPAEHGWRPGWPDAAMRRLYADPAAWRNAALFLGGLLRPDQLREALLPMLTAAGKTGWPELVRQLLHGRRRLKTPDSVLVNVRRRPGQREEPPPAPDDPVLAALAEALRLRAVLLEEYPDGLFAWCFHFLRDHWGWIFPEGERERGQTATRDFAGTLENARAKAGGSWLRAPEGWPLAISPHLELMGHTCAVNALAVLEGGRLASASVDETVRVWDVDGGAPPRRLEGHSDWVRALAVLEGGPLASASDDKTVRVWDAEDGRLLHVLEGHAGAVYALAVLEGGRLASASNDKTVRVWDVDGGAALGRLEGHARGVNALAVLEGGRLASASADGTVRVWDLDGEAPPRVLEGHTDSVFALAVLEGGRLASAGEDRTIRVWDMNRGICLTTFLLNAPGVALASFPGGQRLAVGLLNGEVLILDLIRPIAAPSRKRRPRKRPRQP